MSKLMNQLKKNEVRTVYNFRGTDNTIKIYEPNKETEDLAKDMLQNFASKGDEEWTRLFFINLTNIEEDEKDSLSKESFHEMWVYEDREFIFKEVNGDINDVIERVMIHLGKTWSKLREMNERLEQLSEKEQEDAKEQLSNIISKKQIENGERQVKNTNK